MLDRRRYARFNINTDAIFSYMDMQGQKVQAKAKTKDISCQGVFLLTDSCFDVGTNLDVDIYLDSNFLGYSLDGFMIKGSGQVVRTTDSGMGIDFNCSKLRFDA